MRTRLTKQDVQRRLDVKYGKNVVSLESEYVNKREPITLRCQKCGNKWDILAASAMYGHTKHYCPRCLIDKQSSTWIEFDCAYCGKHKRRQRADIRKGSKNLFCSVKCYNEYKRNVDETFSIYTYREKALQHLPNKCAICGWSEDIRLLEVHHLDENRENCKLDNLIVLCPICHRKLTLKTHKFDKSRNCLVPI